MTADTGPVGGATVVVTGPDAPTTLTTGTDGAYDLGGLPPGDYTITLAVPDGYTASGPLTQTVTVTDAGDALAVPNFALTAVPAPPTPAHSPGTAPGARR